LKEGGWREGRREGKRGQRGGRQGRRREQGGSRNRRLVCLAWTCLGGEGKEAGRAGRCFGRKLAGREASNPEGSCFPFFSFFFCWKGERKEGEKARKGTLLFIVFSEKRKRKRKRKKGKKKIFLLLSARLQVAWPGCCALKWYACLYLTS